MKSILLFSSQSIASISDTSHEYGDGDTNRFGLIKFKKCHHFFILLVHLQNVRQKRSFLKFFISRSKPFILLLRNTQTRQYNIYLFILKENEKCVHATASAYCIRYTAYGVWVWHIHYNHTLTGLRSNGRDHFIHIYCFYP